MSRIGGLFIGAFAGWVVLTGAGMVWAQPAEREDRREERRADEARPPAREARPATEGRSAEARRAKSIIGAEVKLRGGLGVGTVQDIIIDDDGYVDYLVVSHKGKDVLVPWEAAKFDLGHRTATVDITQERFQEVPTYTQEQPPNYYDPTYRQQIYRYYGVTPRAERRIERRGGGQP